MREGGAPHGPFLGDASFYTGCGEHVVQFVLGPSHIFPDAGHCCDFMCVGHCSPHDLSLLCWHSGEPRHVQVAGSELSQVLSVTSSWHNPLTLIVPMSLR